MRLPSRKHIAFVFVALTVGAVIFGGFWRYRLGEDMRVAGACFSGAISYCIAPREWSGKVALPERTAYWHSSRQVDEQGLPVSVAPDGRRFRNPSSIAFSMFGRSSLKFDDACSIYAPGLIALAALSYFDRTETLIEGDVPVWQYDYETQINDVLLRPPFASAFAQAAIIERLLIHACKTGEARYADLARRAGRAFGLPVTRGGLRSEADDFVWFQEVPLPDRHNPFIVNAHLYSIQALLLLDRFFPTEGFRALAERGLLAFRIALPAIDNGYWNRYDLRPRYANLTFKVEAQGVLRSANLRIGDATSRIVLTKDRQSPRSNGFSLAETARRSRDGVDVSGKPVEMWFTTSQGREFAPSTLNAPVELELVFSGPVDRVRAAAVSTRPGPIEFALLSERERASSNGAEIFRYSVGWGDFGWGQLAPEYVPFHAATLASIARTIGDQDLFLRAVRWQRFVQRHGAAQRKGEMVARHTWTQDADLASAVWERFGKLRPEDINEANLLKLIETLPFDASRRAAAFETLALPLE